MKWKGKSVYKRGKKVNDEWTYGNENEKKGKIEFCVCVCVGGGWGGWNRAKKKIMKRYQEQRTLNEHGMEP